MPLFANRKVRIFYAATGAFFGWRWAFGPHGPAWEHAAQVLVQMLLLSTAVQLIRRQWARGRGGGGGVLARIPVRQLVLGKLSLVALALGAEYLLHRWTSQAQLLVGIGLAVAVALGGPVIQRRHEDRSPPPASVERPRLLGEQVEGRAE